MRYMRYPQDNKTYFWRKLSEYETALKTGEGIIPASLAVYGALAGVPKSYASYMHRVWRETEREQPQADGRTEE